MANPADMTDEELNKVIETGVEPDDEPEATGEETEQTETSEEVEETQEEKTETEEETEETSKEEEEEKPVSRREQLRVQSLLKKYGPPPEQARPSQPGKQRGLDYKDELEADEAVIQKLEEDRQIVSDQAYQQGLQQGLTREWLRDLKYEAPAVEKDYPFLNPKDPANFKPAAANAMNEKYLRFVGYNPGNSEKGIPESVQYPDISYREFLEAEMEFANEVATQKIAETTKNIAKQAATTGLRPDGSSAKRLNLNKNPQDMSMEELYASIGQTPPKK